jgi:hypothetical protein
MKKIINITTHRHILFALVLSAGVLFTQCAPKVGCYYNTMSVEQVEQKDVITHTRINPEQPASPINRSRSGPRVSP